MPATFVHADPAATATALAGRVDGGRAGGWATAWLDADAAATRAMDAWLTGLDEPFEGAPFAALAAVLPDGATLWAGNSMPVRDMDGWLPSTDRAITVRSNRGANGIDGVVSTALGSAAVATGPVALVVGDLSFLHDLNALVAAKLHGLSATIVLVNNDGGGIFSFLPQATASIPGAGLPERYEELFGTPHGIDVAPIVTALGGEHVLVGHGDLQAQIERSIGRPGVQVLELRTDRARNVALHREVAAVVAGGDRAMSRIDVDGLRWEVRTRGSGEPLLLVHGFTGRGASWGAHVTAFARAFRVIVVDLPGHGRSAAAADPRRDERRADGRRPGDDPAPPRRGPRGRARLLARGPDRAPPRHRPPRRRRPPRAREPVGGDRGRRRAPGPEGRRRGPGRPHRARRHRRRSSPSGRPSPSSPARAAIPAARAARIRRIRLANRPDGLAASLRGAGQGAMEPLFDRLAEVRAPTLVIAGALDDRARAAGRARSPTASPTLASPSSTAPATRPHDERPIAVPPPRPRLPAGGSAA